MNSVVKLLASFVFQNANDFFSALWVEEIYAI